MSDLRKRINSIKGEIERRKVRKETARQKKIELENDLGKMNVTVIGLSNAIKEKREEIKTLDTKIEELLKKAENEFNTTTK